MFGLNVIRHRPFELGGWWTLAPSCQHTGSEVTVMSVTGWVSSQDGVRRRLATSAEGVPYSQAVPPAYTEWIGERLLGVLEGEATA